MRDLADTPFEHVESAHEYVGLLIEAAGESRQEVEEALAAATAEKQTDRRVQALQLVIYKLDKLLWHMTASSRILNDLCMLRRLLLEEGTETDRAQGAGAR